MFLEWIKLKESRKELARQFKSTLQGIPQDPVHHPEGDVLTHVRLVRKAIPKAVQELKSLQQNSPLGESLSGIDFNLSQQEQEIVTLAAWLHDIGKATATTVGDDRWDTEGATGKIRAIGHQDKEHFLPQLEKLKSVAPPKTVELYLQNRSLVDFLIERHMDFTGGNGFSKKFVAQYFDNGKVKPSLEMKLLLILMWADKMGRIPEHTIAASLNKNKSSLQASIDRSKKFIPKQQNVFSGSPMEFAKMLSSRNMSKQQKAQAVKGKFPHLSDHAVDSLFPESFRQFLEADQSQPTTIKANIPIPDDVKEIAALLKQNDPSVEVKVVGGAVRDYLYDQYHGNGQYKPDDIDLTTNLSEEEILQRLRSPQAQKQGVSVKEKESVDTFGVVFASLRGNETIEIAPYRKDIGSADGRRPDRVERGTIHDDAMRRDLTMNNLYYDIDSGVIQDFNDGGTGIQDVQKGVARPVGDPFQRFDEDKLRVLRLIRFFSRFNPGHISQFLDPKTSAAIQKFKNLRQHGITPERIMMEFVKGIKQARNTASFLTNYAELDLYQEAFPGLNVDVNGLSRLGNSKNIRVILAWILRSNKNVGAALNRLKYPNDISEKVQFLIDALNFGPNDAMGIIKARDKKLLAGNAVGVGGKILTPEEIQAQNQQISMETKNDLMQLAQISGHPEIARQLHHLGSYQPPVIDGKELMQQGLKGAEIGAEQRRRLSSHYAQSLKDFQLNNQDNQQ